MHPSVFKFFAKIAHPAILPFPKKFDFSREREELRRQMRRNVLHCRFHNSLESFEQSLCHFKIPPSLRKQPACELCNCSLPCQLMDACSDIDASRGQGWKHEGAGVESRCSNCDAVRCRYFA